MHNTWRLCYTGALIHTEAHMQWNQFRHEQPQLAQLMSVQMDKKFFQQAEFCLEKPFMVQDLALISTLHNDKTQDRLNRFLFACNTQSVQEKKYGEGRQLNRVMSAFKKTQPQQPAFVFMQSYNLEHNSIHIYQF